MKSLNHFLMDNILMLITAVSFSKNSSHQITLIKLMGATYIQVTQFGKHIHYTVQHLLYFNNFNRLKFPKHFFKCFPQQCFFFTVYCGAQTLHNLTQWILGLFVFSQQDCPARLLTKSIALFLPIST